jgi:LPS export ABC transporter protein LptC
MNPSLDLPNSDFRINDMRRSTALTFTLLSLILGTTACRNDNRTAERLAEDTQEAQKFDSNLTFNNVTLEQAREGGQLLWRIKAKQATYSKDQRNANVIEPQGELFQDGKPVFKIQAQRSDIQQDGKSILLKGKITAIDVRDGAVLKGNEIEWRPAEDILFVRNNFTGSNKQAQVSGKEGRFYTRDRRMEATGQIVAKSVNPDLQMKSDRIVWNLKTEKVSTDRPIQIERYQNKQVTDRGSADQAEFDLKAKIATLRQNAKLSLQPSGLQVSGNDLAWKINQKTLNAEQRVTIVNPAQKVTISGDRGTMRIDQQVATLTGNVSGVGEKNQSTLSAGRVTWYATTQQFQANGNVNYRQTNPPFSLAGPQAAGKLDDQQVAVDGGRVELQIVPEGRGR